MTTARYCYLEKHTDFAYVSEEHLGMWQYVNHSNLPPENVMVYRQVQDYILTQCEEGTEDLLYAADFALRKALKIGLVEPTLQHLVLEQDGAKLHT